MVSFYSSILVVFIVSSAFLGCAVSKDPPLTDFGKRAEIYINEETFKKIFNVNIKNPDELQEALKTGYKELFKTVGLPYDDSIVQQTNAVNKEFKKGTITPQLLFRCQTYAASKILTKQGKLNKSNIDDKAKEYVNELEQAAMSLGDNPGIVQVYVAEGKAIGNFLKREGVTSKEAFNQFLKYYMEELDMYRENPSK